LPLTASFEGESCRTGKAIYTVIKDKTKKQKRRSKTCCQGPETAGVKPRWAQRKRNDAGKKSAPESILTPRLKKRYHDCRARALAKEFQYKNPCRRWL
jgi:hypothetical protein